MRTKILSSSDKTREIRKCLFTITPSSENFNDLLEITKEVVKSIGSGDGFENLVFIAFYKTLWAAGSNYENVLYLLQEACLLGESNPYFVEITNEISKRAAELNPDNNPENQ